MTCTRGNCKFNFVLCSVIHILFAGNIMNMFALQTPCPVEQLKDKERENSKVQLRRWINAGLISCSAKDSIVPFVCICLEGSADIPMGAAQEIGYLLPAIDKRGGLLRSA